jgi:hypothetical protein
MISAERTYQMLGQGALWLTARQCSEALQSARIPHAMLGGLAVCLHGYQRNTVDVDVLIRSTDQAGVTGALESTGLLWSDEAKEFRSADSVAVQILLAGEKAGKNSEVCLPDPANAQNTTEIEGLPVLTLARLIESKIDCGEGSLRRTHKDFADVVELIARHNLGRGFARHLHKSVRATYRQLVLQARAQ